MKPIGPIASRLVPREPAEGWAAHDKRVAEELRAEAQVAATERDIAYRQTLVGYGMPVKDVARVTMSALRDTAALAAVKSFEASDRDACVLAGRPGCGKTTAAAWWLSQPGPGSEYLRLESSRFVPSYQLERVSRYEGDAMQSLERARRLVLDDVGLEYVDRSGSFLALLRGLVDARYANQLPLLVTSNLGADEFAKRYGERVVDRLREVGRYVELDAPSLRGTK